MSAFVIGIPVPAGLDPKTFRVRVVVDRTDGAELTSDDLEKIQAVYGGDVAKPEKPRLKSTKPADARPARSAKKATRR